MVTETDGSSSRLLAGGVPVLALPVDADEAAAPTVVSGWLVVFGTSPALAGAVTSAAVRGCLGLVISR